MPSYKCPEPYVWDCSFRTFYQQIDEDHKGLFLATFTVAAFPFSKSALKNLNAVMIQHFVNEENIMKRAEYVGFPEHKKIHDEFLAKLAGFSCPVGQGDIDFAKQWLVDHVKNIDFKYKRQL
uniref:Hemerythrin n=1 Tax=Magelona berkeleyi TaxID=1490213 RepID=A0A1S6QCN1_9ANNE|nr:hemerythrin [Magelona berkeleyi]